MMRRLTSNLLKTFCSASQPASIHKSHKFALGEYPKALEYSRPFRTINMYFRIVDMLEWSKSGLINNVVKYYIHHSIHKMWQPQ